MKNKEYMALASEWSEKNEKELTDYTYGSNYRAWWHCQEGHTWQAPIKSRFAGYGCPYCSGRRAIAGKNDLATVNPQLAEEWDTEKNRISPREILPWSNRKFWWKCDKCEYIWAATVATRSSGKGCPVCGKKQPGKDEANLAIDFPCISKMWDYDRNDKNPEDFRPQSNVSVWWHCSFGHIWYAQINTMTRSKGKKCPYCTGKRPIPGETDLASCHPEMLKEWDYQKNKLLPEEVTSLSHKCVWWICPNGHSFRRRIANHTLRGGCPICQKAKKKY